MLLSRNETTHCWTFACATLVALTVFVGTARADSGDARAEEPYFLSTHSNWELIDQQSGETYRGLDIYRQLDKPDLVERYRENFQRKKTVRWIGLGGAATGVLASGIGLLLWNSALNVSQHPECNAELDNFERNCNIAKSRAKIPFSRGLTITGGAITLAGATMALLSTIGNPHPVSEQKLRNLAEDPPSSSDQKSDEKAAIGWSIVPTNGGAQSLFHIRW